MKSNKTPGEEMLEGLKQWESDTGSPASFIEGNAFMDGWLMGRNHYITHHMPDALVSHANQ